MLADEREVTMLLLFLQQFVAGRGPDDHDQYKNPNQNTTWTKGGSWVAAMNVLLTVMSAANGQAVL
jgi:hypothetical protein